MTHKLGIETDLFAAIVPQVSQLLHENQPQTDGAPLSVMQLWGQKTMPAHIMVVSVLGHDLPAGKRCCLGCA